VRFPRYPGFSSLELISGLVFRRDSPRKPEGFHRINIGIDLRITNYISLLIETLHLANLPNTIPIFILYTKSFLFHGLFGRVKCINQDELVQVSKISWLNHPLEAYIKEAFVTRFSYGTGQSRAIERVAIPSMTLITQPPAMPCECGVYERE